MSVRAVVLGLLLGLGISAGTYFNDFVIRQTMLVGNHLPISVFGPAMLLLLAINPLLRALGRRWPLQPTELALLIAIALAACGWPGSGFYRGFASIAAMPAHLSQVQPSWRNAQVMSYVPGAAPELAPGQVRDWPELIPVLLGEAQRTTTPELAPMLDPTQRRDLREILDARHVDLTLRQRGVTALNHAFIAPTSDQMDPPLWQRAAERQALPTEARRALHRRDQALAKAETLHQRDGPVDDARLRRQESLHAQALHWERHANRAVLAETLAPWVKPTPQGQGVLVAQGRLDDAVVGGLAHGLGEFAFTNVPWRDWAPVILTWGGLALLIGVASVALALIVHPQWSRRELLPYPIARFVQELARQDQRSRLPALAANRLFWIGFGGLLTLHLVNGLNAWFPGLPAISTSFDFSPLRDLFPNASSIWGSGAYFTPTIYPSVIAFAFFLTAAVSFSLGISQMLFMILGAMLVARGVSMDQSMITAEKANLLRFGAYAGVAMVILYTGRWYYAQVMLRTVGLKSADVSVTGAWAGRILIVCLLASVLVLHQAGLSPVLAALFVLLVLMMLLVLSRIVAETGAFFLQPWWMPVAVLVALFGVEAIGPTAFIVLAIGSTILVGDPREALMPYITNALQIVERTGRTQPHRAAPWLGVMVIAGFGVAGLVTLMLQYQHGLSGVDGWTRGALPSMPFNQFTQYLAQMGAHDTLVEATWTTGLDRLGLINPAANAWAWTGLGVALVLATALARLRLPWWPLHPVAFLVWGTYPISMFAASFLLGWIVKLGVVNIGGAAGYRRLMPLMIGVIAGELSGGLVWIAVGTVYYAVTGRVPESYSIFPG